LTAGSFVFGKRFLGLAELLRVDHSSLAAPFRRKPDVQHFMINDVLCQIAGNRRGIEFAGDDDSPVTGIVMAQDAAGILGAPAEARRGNLAAEEAVIPFANSACYFLSGTRVFAKHGS
jgi:hypothetical protein